jgi:hypothetical protein
MKTIKISLAIVVIGIIGYFVANSIIDVVNPPLPPPVVNEFTKIIDEEISDLQKLSVTNFKALKASYQDVLFDIDEYYGDKRLGKDQLENDQSKERLSKNLYTIYVSKFIKQSYIVFGKSEWSPVDLNFIRSESITLRNSKFLDKNLEVYDSFYQFQQVLSKYDEINNFIASCKGFSYSPEEFNSQFPIDAIKQKIARATSYRNQKLENVYVNNCTRLHNQLNEIPKFLFYAHVRYLDKKINNWSGMYDNYNSQGEYVESFYKKINNEINGLENDIYNVSNKENEKTKLYNKLDQDYNNARAYFSKN